MNRVLYLPYRVATDLVSLFSRMVNALFFAGSTAQTLSARAYLDGRDSRVWEAIGKVINLLFFWQDDHIKSAWETEVARARYVLNRLEGMR